MKNEKMSAAKKVDKKSKVMTDEKIEALTNEFCGEEMPETKQQKPKLLSIKLDKLHPFENHPYKVLDDDSMTELKESIATQGFLNRIIVRPFENNSDEYEIISGHRRVHAAELLGLKDVPAIEYFIDRNEATLLMVDSNIQRENLTLMEKAKSYQMKLDAIKHQGTSRQNVGKSEESADKISKTESGRTVQRLIRLNYLVPELQQFVDEGKMKVLPAVEISYLDEECQRDIVDRILETEAFPSHAQARKMRALFESGNLNYDTVTEIMDELKPNQVEYLKLPMEDLRRYLPCPMTPEEARKYMLNLAKKEYDRQHNRDAR